MTTHEANIEAMSAEIGGPLLQLGDITTASTEQQNCLKHDGKITLIATFHLNVSAARFTNMTLKMMPISQ